MKLYVGTYKKYNEGSLEGKWLDLDDYSDKDEFLEACAEIHKDEKDPEFMFQDSETDYKWEEDLYCEHSAPEEYWEIKDEMARLHVSDEKYDAWLTGGYENASADNVRKCDEQCCGKYDSGADFAEQFAYEVDCLNPNAGYAKYINWEDVWDDYEADGMWFEDGYVFDPNR